MRISSLATVLAVGLLASAASAQSTWPNVNLPTTFQAAGSGFTEDFETAAGVVPSYMAVTEIDAATGAADPEAWANIGQNAACLNPNGGSFSLEMGLMPGSSNFHDVQNALVIGLNGGGTSQFYLDFAMHNGGEELDAFDGVWVSDDGVNWFQAAADWDTLAPSSNDWTQVVAIDLTAAGANLTGDWYLMFAQEDNFPYEAAGTTASDGVGVDDIEVTLTPTPPPSTTWNIPNIPGSFTTAPYSDDFESYGGTPPAFMALNAMDPNFNAGFADAWCDINGATFTPNSGTAALEMGGNPSSATGIEVRNAMVVGIDGNGITDLQLDAFFVDHGEEDDALDGVWVSANGTDWWGVFGNGDWNGTIGGTGVWEQHTAMLNTTPVDTSGQFYLMIAQDDNFPYANADGIGADDITVDSPAPPGPSLTLTGTCPGPVTLDANNLTPSGQAAILWGAAGSTTKPSGACAGTTVDIASPSFILTTADANGDVSLTQNAPSALCGMTMQVVDVTTCQVSNTAIL